MGNATANIDAVPAWSNDLPVMAENVCKEYAVANRETIQVLRNVSVRARWGQMTGIVGPSGSGKSTLLYCLAGLEPISSGSVDLMNIRINTLGRAASAKFRRSHLGFVFQSYNLVPSMNVWENIALPFMLRNRRISKRRASDLLERFGLAKLARADVTGLSGGEQQRVALVRVLATEPRIVFADEPTGALDQHTGDVVAEELRTIASDPSRAVIVVTHSARVAERCDAIVELVDGQLSQARGFGQVRS